jgi:hypothetical protein
MQAKITIEPSDSNGVATWIRSKGEPQVTFWKWYENKIFAFIEAEQMGFASSGPIVPSSERYFPNMCRTLHEEITTTPEYLKQYAFHQAGGPGLK